MAHGVGSIHNHTHIHSNDYQCIYYNINRLDKTQNTYLYVGERGWGVREAG